MHKCSLYLLILMIASLYCESFARTPPPPPPPAIECFKCNSDVLPDCANNPSKDLPHSQCSHFRQQCVTTIIDGVTFRGCTTEVQIPIDVEDFIYCNKSLCNLEIYPPGRRKCYQCEGKGCLTKFEATLKPCRNYVEGDYCVTDVIDETDIIRGCLSDTDYSSGPFAQICQVNGCNNHPAITKVECIDCSSDNNYTNCIRNLIGAGKSCSVPVTKTCTIDELLGRDSEKCFIYHKYGKVIRGCTRYAGKLQLEEKFFTNCEGNRCNKDCINDRKCIICDSHDDPMCGGNNEINLIPQICPRQSFCSACQRSDDVITRGCGHLDNDEGCYKCQDSDGCNKNIILKCYNCISQYDPNCAQLIDLKKIKVEICSNHDECIVAVRKDGHTIRGCSNAKSPCGRNGNCQVCNKNLCNKEIYPKSRQLCYHCADDLECRQNLYGKKPIPCKKYTRRAACFQYINKNYEMIRGCNSDNEFDLCKAEGDDKCLICSQSGCNNRLAVRASKISCIECKKTDKECPWSQKSETAVKCTQDIPYFLNETCFSRLEEDGTATRGCSTGKEACKRSAKDCIICDSNGCNKKRFMAQSCIQSSQSDANSQSSSGSLSEGKLCKTDVQYFENRGCYVKREDDMIKRGCFVDLSNDDQQKCKKKEAYCLHCEGQNCNVMNAPNLGVVLNTSIKLFICYSTFLLIMLK